MLVCVLYMVFMAILGFGLGYYVESKKDRDIDFSKIYSEMIVPTIRPVQEMDDKVIVLNDKELEELKKPAVDIETVIKPNKPKKKYNKRKTKVKK